MQGAQNAKNDVVHEYKATNLTIIGAENAGTHRQRFLERLEQHVTMMRGR